MFYKPLSFTDVNGSYKTVNISYKHPLRTPVRFTITPDAILINAFVKFDKRMLVPYRDHPSGQDLYLETKSSDFTYADAVIEGICKHWEKTYVLPFAKDPIPLKVNIVRDTDPEFPDKQRTFNVRPAAFTKTSYVMSPPWRWIWGFFLNFSPESAFPLNWSLKHPGAINMNLRRYRYLHTFERVAAHEFGHILGIGDAYGAHYRFYYEAPGTKDYMMNSDTSVHDEELVMALTAHIRGRMQYFPFRFSAKRYFARLLCAGRNVKSGKK